ncbi:hypothetical protein MtrunA17_Chr7g0232901 [Medicago truncatula]|uniref:Uncharacterized protein n=1 Tax=Medicago truncatula TaxID=3880 RepID=A0A396GZD9_MEDTR|nr:hypothetical protein MtrunA17_Chr7g0232901 [Medicago truncatula]
MGFLVKGSFLKAVVTSPTMSRPLLDATSKRKIHFLVEVLGHLKFVI